MKDRKGFTLVELLAVLTILAIVAVITVPLVGTYITNSREKAYEVELQTLENAAKNWIAKYSARATWDENGNFYLPIETLQKSEFLEDKVIVDPRDPEESVIDGCIKISRNPTNKYELTYKYQDECE